MFPGNSNRITAAIGEDTKQEIKEKGFLFFYAYFAYFRLFCMGKYRRKTGRIHAMQAGENGRSQHSGIRHFLRARFYHSTKFRLPAQFVLWESCWGCHPKPAFLRLAPLEKSTHESDFMIVEATTRYFKSKGISKLPASKALQAEIEQLMREKNSLYNEYREKREKTKELQTVKGNIEQSLASSLMLEYPPIRKSRVCQVKCVN